MLGTILTIISVGAVAVLSFVCNNRSRDELQEMTEDQDCYSCDRKAEIFQAEGDFCLHCWQRETHPNV
jgi:hypothetical protein